MSCIIEEFTCDGKFVSYHKNGVYHNDYGPAIFEQKNTGTTTLEKWLNNGIFHRTDGPAFFIERVHRDGNTITSKMV